jgi:hypothetical protein
LFHELEDDNTIKKWGGFVSDFFCCFDREKNNYIHLPNSGGYYEQDEFFFTIWQCIRNKYYEAMNDDDFNARLAKRKEQLRKKHGKS